MKSHRPKLVPFILFVPFFLGLHCPTAALTSTNYAIVDTGQTHCFSNENTKITCPQKTGDFYGQDAQYTGNQPKYTNNGDGTVSDLVTGLMWQQEFIRIQWYDAEAEAAAATTGGYNDWRLPTTKELYSLMDFSGNQGSASPSSSTPPSDAVPFIDTTYFNFEYPSDSRYIDAQYATSSEYTSTVSLDGIREEQAIFGVNLADGRIKGYPQSGTGPNKDFYTRFVRGNTSYGENSFRDNGDGTISDLATGLTWMRIDSGNPAVEDQLSGYTYSDGSLNWGEALSFCESLEYAGKYDWRLPNAKELHSLVDYSRSPDYTQSAAIDELFQTTSIVNEGGDNDYPGFWSSTSFEPGRDAIVIYFGEALGLQNDLYLDVHGAGAQRTDLKEGSPSAGSGPQGDVRRVYNYARCVRQKGDEAVSQSSSLPAIFELLLK